jgi:uncharacterized pyridoxal phosphate-containing UPF0001 family protein
MDLWNELSEKRALLDKAIDTLASNGYDLAEKERDYRIAIKHGSNMVRIGSALFGKRNYN